MPDRLKWDAVKGDTQDDGDPPTQADDSEKDCQTHEDPIDGEDAMIEEQDRDLDGGQGRIEETLADDQ